MAGSRESPLRSNWAGGKGNFTGARLDERKRKRGTWKREAEENQERSKVQRRFGHKRGEKLKSYLYKETAKLEVGPKGDSAENKV